VEVVQSTAVVGAEATTKCGPAVVHWGV